jgi:hypothetical protein
MAPLAQRSAGDGLGPGGRPGLAVVKVIFAGPARMLDGRGPVAAGDCGLRGPLPQHADRCPLVSRVLSFRGAWRGQPGGGGVAGGREGGSAGAFGPLSGADQRAGCLGADLGGVGILGHRSKGVEVVAGDDVGDFLAVA